MSTLTLFHAQPVSPAQAVHDVAFDRVIEARFLWLASVSGYVLADGTSDGSEAATHAWRTDARDRLYTAMDAYFAAVNDTPARAAVDHGPSSVA